ncbi:nuclear receptor-interacting protein 3-like [Rhipicephalus microplus]|uniref:nuclear receptor-interacting protein 3-like n=1 Tax=Rhipicephalus microplus TaxID=6941 RepID=UPI003F6AF761
MNSADDQFDICLAAYKRQRVRAQRKASAVLQSLQDQRASGLAGQAKGLPPQLINSVNGPPLDEITSLKRMHVPPMVNCECSGVTVCALLNTSCPFSTMSEHTVHRLRLDDQVMAWKQSPQDASALHQHVYALRTPVRGCVKYVDLEFGSWKQVHEFAVVEEPFPEVSLGIDFLRRSQCLINFENATLIVGGVRGEKVQLLNAKDVTSQSMMTLASRTSLL